MKKIFLWGFIGIAALIGIVVALAPSAEKQPQPVPKVKEDNKQATKQHSKNQIYKVGNTVKIGDTEIAVLEAKIGNNPDPYAQTKYGKVLSIEVKGTNNGTQPWLISPTDFYLYDSSGNRVEEFFGMDQYSPLSGEINQGKQIIGQIKFDAKSGIYDLVYKPYYLQDQEIHWTIEAK